MQLAVKEKNKQHTEVNVDANVPVPEQANEVLTQAQTTTDKAHNALVDSGVLNSPWDVSILIFFFVAAFLYGFSLGRDRIIIILTSIYMALAVVEALPDFVLNVSFNGNFGVQITAFIGIFVILFFFVSRSALMRTIGSTLSDGKWYQTLIFSMLHVGLLISITMSFLPPDTMQRFTPLTQQIFTGEWQRFGWIAAPILAMVVFGSKKEE